MQFSGVRNHTANAVTIRPGMHTHYTTFGSSISEMSFSSDTFVGYRYGFNGEEKMDDISGEGMAYDLGARFYDARLGRMFSLDPLAYKYPSWSAYSYGGNCPIIVIDIKGLAPGDEKHGNTRTTNEGSTEYFDATADGADGKKGAWVSYDPNLKQYGEEDKKLIETNNTLWATNYLNELQSQIVTLSGKETFELFKNELILTVIEMNKFPSFMENAFKQLGVDENANCDIVKSYYATLIRKGPTECSSGTRNQSAWFASFVSFVLSGTEFGTSGDPGAYWWSVTERPVYRDKALHAEGENWGEKTKSPSFGAIVVFKSNSHVGILVGITSSGQYIMLGGNQNDCVNLTVWGNDKLNKFYILPNNFDTIVNLPLISNGYTDKTKGGGKTN